MKRKAPSSSSAAADKSKKPKKDENKKFWSQFVNDHCCYGGNPTFDLDKDDEKEVWRFFEEEGYVVVKATDDSQEGLKMAFRNWKLLHPDLAENRYMQNKICPGIFSKGIVGDGVGWHKSEFAWFARDKAAPIFRRYYNYKFGEENVTTLYSSWDTGAIWRNPNFAHKKEGKITPIDVFWPHVDQGDQPPPVEGIIQGLVNFMPSGTREYGGFACFPGSHLLHDWLLGEMRAEGINTKKNFLQLSPNLTTYCLGVLRCLNIPSGYMVLWDSRLIHSPISPINPQEMHGPVLRVVQYVSMLPSCAVGLKPTDAKDRLAVLAKSVHHTSHHPIGPMMRIQHPPYPRHKSLANLNSVALPLDECFARDLALSIKK